MLPSGPEGKKIRLINLYRPLCQEILTFESSPEKFLETVLALPRLQAT